MNQINLNNTLWKDVWKGAVVIVSVPTVLLIFVGIKEGLTGVQQWLIPISGFVSLLTISIGSWLAVNNYRLKVQAEKRLDDSSKIESEIKLLTQFSEMIEIANSRYKPVLSGEVIEGLFKNRFITENDFKDEANIRKLSQKLQVAIFVPSHGLATQKAAIGEVYAFGKEHSILREAAIEGLTEIKESFIQSNFDYEFITKFIDELKKLSGKKQ